MNAKKGMSAVTPGRVRTVHEFQALWKGIHNFLLDPSLFLSTGFELPPLRDIVAMLRDDEDVKIRCNNDARRMKLESVADWFRGLPMEDAMVQPFNISHFKTAKFMRQTEILADFRERALLPWQDFLRSAGFSWDRMNPYIFISGRSSLTPYHMDRSHVLAYQCYGEKKFNCLKDPERHAPRDLRERFVKNPDALYEWLCKPEQLQEDEVTSFTMKPGDLLWNVILTPHWVEALHDRPAMSINISHGGLKLHGKYCPLELEARQWDPHMTVTV